jgi:hypothetical protein
MAVPPVDRRPTFVALCGLVVAALAWSSMCHEPPPAPTVYTELPELHVTLGASRQDVVTIGLSEEDQKTFDRSGNFQEPHRLVMTLPDKRRFELVSRSTLVRLDGLLHDASRDEIVTTVYARRPLTPGRFQEAVADMLATIRDMGVEPNADMAAMPNRGDVPGYGDAGITFPAKINAKAVELSKDGTRVHCTINPDPEKGWYVLYIFSFSLERWPSTLRHRESQRMLERAVMSARPFLPAAVQIEEIFPSALHVFNNFVFKDPEDLHKTFITEAYFGQRYLLTMTADVELEPTEKTITRLRGEPTFVLKELESLARVPDSLGRLEPTWGREHRFDLQAWNKVYAAKGDFSVIDITIDKTPLSGNAAELAAFYVRRQRSRRDRITLREEPATTESSARSDISQDSRED